MERLSSIDLETAFVGLVCDSILQLWTKHHLVALHVVIQAIFKCRLEGFHVDQIKVNKFVSSDLNSVVALHKIYKAPEFKLMIKLPTSSMCFCVGHFFKKEDAARTPHYQSFSLDHDHLPQVQIGHLFVPVICEVIRIYHEGLTLPVEGVYLKLLGIIEALLWIVLARAIHCHGHQIALRVPYEPFGFDIVDEMEVGQRVIVEKVYEYQVVCQEAASDIRMRQVVVAHRVIVKANDFIDMHLSVLYLLFRPHLLPKGSQPKLTIVIVDKSIFSPIVILSDLFRLYVLFWITTD